MATPCLPISAPALPTELLSGSRLWLGTRERTPPLPFPWGAIVLSSEAVPQLASCLAGPHPECPGQLTGLPPQPANILLDEHGHVRISDLGLACDFSKKKPHASV